MLYHRPLYWQSQWDIESKDLLLSAKRLSNHLRGRLNSPDYKHDIKLESLCGIVQSLYGQDIEPFEVEVDNNNKVVKMVVRVSYDRYRDISIVIRDGFIVTCWLNKNTDLHISLGENKYEKC